ncbi:tetratricopeptide repeat protein [Candidatus Pelagibacter sp.]|uniref:tetratricopeptide repeat protein n=1 Tax=Candidatus Pelagibacter sp. TaxID=2024849 RepID=UPI003F838E78
MKKFLTIFLIFFFNLSSLFADDRVKELNKLFKDLKTTNYSIASKIEQEIWQIWSTHPNDENLTMLLNKGSSLVNESKYNQAIDIFSKAINLDPLWAEAWNKRATVFYLSGNFEKSQKDIDKVLELEKRHFGALAGQGLVNIQLKNYNKAIESYEKAKEIYPTMKSPDMMINQIKELIKKQSI